MIYYQESGRFMLKYHEDIESLDENIQIFRKNDFPYDLTQPSNHWVLW